MHPRIAEIHSYLQHNDHSLAVRRILDASLDTGDLFLLNEAIALSHDHRAKKQAGNNQVTNGFVQSAEALLEKISFVTANFNYEVKPLVTAKNISKTYAAGNFGLKPISVQVNTGDVLGVVGENGHGKTTLLRCIAAQLALDQGSVEFPQLEKPDLYDVKHHLAFIPQRIPKWRGLLKDNLHFSAALSGIKGARNEVMVNFMLERLELTPYAHLEWTQISSGYRTRFEIARILLQKPKLLILDEPLANLDINAQQSILTDLRFMTKSVHHPMGVILSSQQLHEVEKIADTVLLIKNGLCVFTTGEQEKTAGTSVIEFETTTGRDALLHILGNESIDLHYNGSFYTLSAPGSSATSLLMKILNANVPVTYFRDITHSTKRFI